MHTHMDMHCLVRIWFLVSLVCVGLTGTTNPGFKARITQNGLNYANKVAVATLAKSVRQLKIPDQSGKAGHVSWSVSGLSITGFTVPASSMQIQKAGIHWSASGAGMSLHGNFRYKYKKGWIKLSDHGSFDASLSGVSFSITINVGDASGKPHLTDTGCSANIGGVKIHFHGGAAWIYNLFSHMIAGKIKDSLKSQLCPLITKAIDTDANKQLAKLPMNVVIAKKFLLDYSLVANPSFNSKFMETSHKGEIYWKTDKNEYPTPPKPLPASSDVTRMLYLWISEYMGNTLAYNAFQHRFLRYNLTAKDLPPANRSILNTTCSLKCIGTLIPQIGKKYPNSTVKLNMYATAQPHMSINNGYTSINFTGNVDMYAQTPKGSTPFLLTITNVFVITGTASIHNQLLTGKITNTTLHIGVKNSKVGPVQPAVLQIIMNGAVELFVVPMLNKAGQKGLVLPVTDNIRFNNAKLTLLKGALLIATDLTYLSDEQLRQEKELIETYGHKSPMEVIRPQTFTALKGKSRLQFMKPNKHVHRFEI